MSGPFGADEIARLRSVIDTLKQSYNLIIIDSPPLLAMTDGLVLRQRSRSDHLCLPLAACI